MVLVAGCTDLASVADFARCGADATGASDVFDGYVAAEANAVRLAYPPTDHPTPDEIRGRQAAVALDRKAPALAAGNQAALDTLSLYLTVLGKLASDGLIDVKDQANSIGASLNALGATSAASVVPAGNLVQFLVSAPLDAWRNRAVGNLIQGANRDVLLLCADLSTDARAVAAAWGSDIQAARSYYARIPGPASDIRGSMLMMALANQEATGFAANQQKAKALGAALDKVCSGQKLLYENVDKLDLAYVTATLNGYSAEIQNAAKVRLK
ncbi:MAG TPA: hypothetical protein VGV37_15910 [Aliidongia sp.]|uniref:hypothetical protein n=1 Tax=Aliidongia sp. TaxID=1914230 RepID=UPI002DDDA176|nr:hypothetical protein [Aliidongia sp.]HEV2676008.1 hypothetical protein [Aliidongia sp.]